MHTLNTKGPAGLTEAEKDILQQWMLYNRQGEYLNPLLKFCLESIANEKDAAKKKELVKEFNDNFLHYSFNDARDNRGILSTTTIETQTTTNTKKQKEKAEVEKSQCSLTPEEQNNMSTEELVRLIKEDKTFYKFELESADLSFLKKIDWENVAQPSRIEIALRRLPDFAFNKVLIHDVEYLLCLEVV
jgi:hypothetical protein